MKSLFENNSRVLVADDQPDVLEALRLLLKSEGYLVETAPSPKRILAALEEKDFDLVILSIGVMPSPSGKDLAASLGVRLSPQGYFMSEGNPGRATDAKGLFFCTPSPY